VEGNRRNLTLSSGGRSFVAALHTSKKPQPHLPLGMSRASLGHAVATPEQKLKSYAHDEQSEEEQHSGTEQKPEVPPVCLLACPQLCVTLSAIFEWFKHSCHQFLPFNNFRTKRTFLLVLVLLILFSFSTRFRPARCCKEVPFPIAVLCSTLSALCVQISQTLCTMFGAMLGR
jgi:hypothetical protein